MKKKFLTTPEEILALKDTDTKIYTEGNKGYNQFVKGTLCYFDTDGSIIVSSEFGIGKGFVGKYILVENPIILKEGHIYITRDGRKAFVASIDNSDGIARGCIEVWNEICEWDLNGKCFDNAGEAKNVDIVEEITGYKVED